MQKLSTRFVPTMGTNAHRVYHLFNWMPQMASGCLLTSGATFCTTPPSICPKSHVGSASAPQFYVQYISQGTWDGLVIGPSSMVVAFPVQTRQCSPMLLPCHLPRLHHAPMCHWHAHTAWRVHLQSGVTICITTCATTTTASTPQSTLTSGS